VENNPSVGGSAAANWLGGAPFAGPALNEHDH